jgi:hypothetical protein
MIVIASDPSVSFPMDRTTKRVREAAALLGQILETELPKGGKTFVIRNQRTMAMWLMSR